MPITTNKDSVVLISCSACEGDGVLNEDQPDEVACTACKGSGRSSMSTIDWINKNVGLETFNETGTYTFDDMVNAFKLGIMCEAGDFPSYDYMPAEKIINKYFSPIDEIK